MNPIMAKPIAVAMAIFSNSLLSGFVHRFTKRIESLANWRAGSANKLICSISVKNICQTLNKCYQIVLIRKSPAPGF